MDTRQHSTGARTPLSVFGVSYRTNVAGIKAIDEGVESHNEFGKVERYRAYLQNIFDRVKFEKNLYMEKKVAHLPSKLASTQKDHLEWCLLYSSLKLLHGVSVHSEELRNQYERVKALHVVKAQMMKLVAKSRLSCTTPKWHKCKR